MTIKLKNSGSITISNNITLTNLNIPLTGSISGNLIVSGNSSLQSMDLGSPTDVGGNLSVTDNSSLDSVDLNSLTNTGGDLIVSGNNSAISLSASSLSDVGGDLIVSDNSSLQSTDLGSLGATGGDLVVSDNSSLQSIDLGSVTTTGGDLTIDNNESLNSLNAASLDNVGGALSVNNNDSLQSLNLGSLTTAGSDLVITGNNSLQSTDLNSLTDTGGNLNVSGNDSLTSLDLGSLNEVGGDLAIDNNSNLASVNLSSPNVSGTTLIVLSTPDPFQGATSFKDDFTNGLDTTNSWDTSSFNEATYTIVDQTSLINPLSGSTKALKIHTDSRYAYNISGIKLKPALNGGIWAVNNNSTKSYSVRGMVMFEASPSLIVGRCGLSIKSIDNAYPGYFLAVGKSNPVSYSNEGTSDTILNSTGLGPSIIPITSGAPLPTLPNNQWLGFRIDLEQVSPGNDKLTVYTRTSLTDPWTKITDYTLGYGNISDWRFGNLTFGFDSSGAGNYDGTYFKGYLSNFEIYVKEGPI